MFFPNTHNLRSRFPIGSVVFVVGIIAFLGNGCIQSSPQTTENNYPSGDDMEYNQSSSTTTDIKMTEIEEESTDQGETQTENTAESPEKDSKEAVTTELQTQLDSVVSLVENFDKQIQENPDMLTSEQKNTWQSQKDSIVQAKQEAKTQLDALISMDESANETQWKDQALQTKKAIQDYALKYVNTKFDVLGITNEQSSDS